MNSACPFAKACSPDTVCPVVSDQSHHKLENNEEMTGGKSNGSDTLAAKCPFGYDSQNFKLGPLSCMICQALLFESSKCMPCLHKYCKVCIARFKDCPLCGADIEKIEPDLDLQALVDRFIDGHARIKRSQVNSDEQDTSQKKKVIYEDVSMERGAFLVQQAMRAFRAKNVGSARSRLSICAEDIREQLHSLGPTAELCSQLGAVLGVLGDCCREIGDSASAVGYYEESVEFLSKVHSKDIKDTELIHTLSVSLNKIGDLKYYDGDLQSARSYYVRSLDSRLGVVNEHPNATSQVVDLAVSFAKVADVDRNLGDENTAIHGFQEAIKRLESLKVNDSVLERRRLSVLEFVRNQLEEQGHNPEPFA